MELLQNLWQTYACVASEKKLSPKNGVASKFMANVRFFLLVYTCFSNIVNDSASLHRLITNFDLWKKKYFARLHFLT